MLDPNKKQIGILSPFVLISGIVFGCLLIFFSVLGVYLLRPQPARPVVGTALIQVIEIPTDTPILPTTLPTDTKTPEPGTPLPPAPGVINIGAVVKVNGTGLDGLRIRDEPGLGGKILFVAIESEIFRVLDGPREFDSYTWWLLVSPFDESFKGWAVSNYLVLEQNP